MSIPSIRDMRSSINDTDPNINVQKINYDDSACPKVVCPKCKPCPDTLVKECPICKPCPPRKSKICPPQKKFAKLSDKDKEKIDYVNRIECVLKKTLKNALIEENPNEQDLVIVLRGISPGDGGKLLTTLRRMKDRYIDNIGIGGKRKKKTRRKKKTTRRKTLKKGG